MFPCQNVLKNYSSFNFTKWSLIFKVSLGQFGSVRVGSFGNERPKTSVRPVLAMPKVGRSLPVTMCFINFSKCQVKQDVVYMSIPKLCLFYYTLVQHYFWLRKLSSFSDIHLQLMVRSFIKRYSDNSKFLLPLPICLLTVIDYLGRAWAKNGLSKGHWMTSECCFDWPPQHNCTLSE